MFIMRVSNPTCVGLFFLCANRGIGLCIFCAHFVQIVQILCKKMGIFESQICFLARRQNNKKPQFPAVLNWRAQEDSNPQPFDP